MAKGRSLCLLVAHSLYMQTEITEEIEKLKGKRGEHKDGIQVFHVYVYAMYLPIHDRRCKACAFMCLHGNLKMMRGRIGIICSCTA